MQIKSKASFDELFRKLSANETPQHTPLGEARRAQNDIVVRAADGSETRYKRNALDDAPSALQRPAAPSQPGPAATTPPALPQSARLLAELDSSQFENGGRGRLIRSGDPEIGTFVHVGIQHVSFVEGAMEDRDKLAQCGVNMLKHLMLLGRGRSRQRRSKASANISRISRLTRR